MAVAAERVHLGHALNGDFDVVHYKRNDASELNAQQVCSPYERNHSAASANAPVLPAPHERQTILVI